MDMSLIYRAQSKKSFLFTLGGELETERGDGAGAGAGAGTGTGTLSALQALLSSSDRKPSPDSGLFLEEDMISETERIL